MTRAYWFAVTCLSPKCGDVTLEHENGAHGTYTATGVLFCPRCHRRYVVHVELVDAGPARGRPDQGLRALG